MQARSAEQWIHRDYPNLTEVKLLQQYGSFDRVLESASGMQGKLGESLRTNAEQGRLSQKLARLRSDLELGWNLKSFRYRPA